MIDKRPIFDRTVGTALLLTIALETIGAVHWAGRMSHRIEQLEIQAQLTHPIDLRLARLEEQVISISDSVRRIERDVKPAKDAHD